MKIKVLAHNDTTEDMSNQSMYDFFLFGVHHTIPYYLWTKSAVHIWVVFVPYNNSESFLHVGKSVLLQMQDLQQACEAIFHPMMHTSERHVKD